MLAIDFLDGVTLAYMGAIQFEHSGAENFVDDMVARALDPSMPVIIVSGR